MDVVDGADEGHHPLVPHPVALHDVQDLLGDQDRRVGRLPERERLEGPAQLHREPVRPVRGRAELLGAAGEHDGVPALLGYLGERPLDVRARGVLRVDVAQDHLLQDHLEPDAGTGHGRGFLARQFLALRLGQLAPVRGAVQGAPLRARAVELLVQRCVPVDLGGGVVGQCGGRFQQAAGEVVLGRPVLCVRPNGAACHGAAPRFVSDVLGAVTCASRVTGRHEPS